MSASTVTKASEKESVTSDVGSRDSSADLSSANWSADSFKDAGVHNVEMYAKAYSGPVHRFALFFSIFLVAYAYGLDGTLRFSLQTYATSSYSQHSLLATVNCIKAVIAAAGQIWFARASDVFGRFSMLILSVLFYVIGTIIQSQATDVSKFAAGACFYQLGYTGVILILEVIATDFSNLNWRIAASFVPAMPFIINTWVSGNILSDLGTRWKWGIGMWAFIFPLACVPLACCMLHMRWLAIRQGLELRNEFKELRQHAGKKQSLFRYLCVDIFLWKLDFIGLLLLCVGFGCVLIPFTLAGGSQQKWKTAHIIVPEVIGWVVVWPLYILWEMRYAKDPLTPWSLVKDRGVFFALVIAFLINFAWYMQGDYMYTVLIVAVNESVKSANRITSLYSFVSVITGVIMSLFIVKIRRTKPFILFGISMWFLAFGLLTRYRGDHQSHSGIIGSLCVLGFGAGFFTYTTMASIQATTRSHQRLAVITALYLATYNIGSSVGAAVSGAIWTNILPKELNKRLSPELAQSAYGSPFTFIVTYTWNTVERRAVVVSYRHVQRILSIVGLCFCVPLLFSALMLRDKHMSSVVAINDLKEGEEVDDYKGLDLFGWLKSKIRSPKQDASSISVESDRDPEIQAEKA